MKPDAIVIGSGASGMTAAIILARSGRKVLVLESHSHPGGLMQTYRRQGLSLPTGVHCLGALAPGQILRRYLDYLGVSEGCRFLPMDPEGFEDYLFPDFSFRVPVGREAFRQRLEESFPGEEAAIARFFEDMERAAQSFPLYRLRSEREEAPPERLQQALGPYLDGLSADRRLKAVLAASTPLHGTQPSDCPIYVHLLVLDSLLQSAWRIDESVGSLADAYAAAFKAAGGSLRLRARVGRVLTEERRIRGVELSSGERISAEIVVYSGHPHSLSELCQGSGLRKTFLKRISGLPDSIGLFGLALKWPGPDCPFRARDGFIYSSLDTEEGYRQNIAESSELPASLYCQASPEPGPDGNFRVVALAIIPADAFAAWSETKSSRRGAKYAALKTSIGARIMAVLEARWPEVAGRLEPIDSYSPLSLRDYTGAPGGAYGIRRGVGELLEARISTATRVRGLYLVGQGVLLPGILPAVITGVDACARILGREALLSEIDQATR